MWTSPLTETMRAAAVSRSNSAGAGVVVIVLCMGAWWYLLWRGGTSLTGHKMTTRHYSLQLYVVVCKKGSGLWSNNNVHRCNRKTTLPFGSKPRNHGSCRTGDWLAHCSHIVSLMWCAVLSIDRFRADYWLPSRPLGHDGRRLPGLPPHVAPHDERVEGRRDVLGPCIKFWASHGVQAYQGDLVIEFYLERRRPWPWRGRPGPENKRGEWTARS